LGIGDWGLVLGDWRLVIWDWSQSPIPNPQSPIPNPHFILIIKFGSKEFNKYFIKIIKKYYKISL